MFWKHPPESTARPRPVSSRIRSHISAAIAARVFMNIAAETPVGSPSARTRISISRIIPASRSRSGSPLQRRGDSARRPVPRRGLAAAPRPAPRMSDFLMPRMAATPSNRRPIPVVSGQLRPDAEHRLTSAQPLAVNSLRRALASGPPQQRRGHAVGSFTALSPPGSGMGRRSFRCAQRRHNPRQEFPAPDGAVRLRSRCRPRSSRCTFPVQIVVGHAGGHVGVVVLYLYKLQTLARGTLAGVGSGEIVRVQVADEHSGATSNIRSKCAICCS